MKGDKKRKRTDMLTIIVAYITIWIIIIEVKGFSHHILEVSACMLVLRLGYHLPGNAVRGTRLNYRVLRFRNFLLTKNTHAIRHLFSPGSWVVLPFKIPSSFSSRSRIAAAQSRMSVLLSFCL